MLTIVMYHFVRELAQSRYPRLRARTADEFAGQLGYIEQHYVPVCVEDCIAALSGGPELPSNALLLTFDDGYADDYLTVFPLLDAAGIQGAFFPPVRAIAEHVVLDVNKIHFILASVSDARTLLPHVRALHARQAREHDLPPFDDLYEKLAVANRFDPPEVIFIKRLLQRELPPKVRASMTHELFDAFVSRDEAAFARELYCSREQLRCMVRHGMHVGSHGYAHLWLNTLSRAEQAAELDASVAFLDELGVPRDVRTLCYPYGAYDEQLLELARQRQFRLGFTTEVALADLTAESALTLPRLDTNDLPTSEGAAANAWTQRVK